MIFGGHADAAPEIIELPFCRIIVLHEREFFVSI